MVIRTVYESNVLKLLEKVDLKRDVELDVVKSSTERTFGLIQLEHKAIEELIGDIKYASW